MKKTKMTAKGMTELKPHTTLHIPSREEFHHLSSNILSESDFSTDYPSCIQVNKVASAISWTYSNEKNRNIRRKY